MRMHTRTFLCVVALLISTIAPLTHPFELDENSKPSYANSNDGFGPIEYTDQHFSPTQFEKNILDIFKITLTSK